MTIICELTNMIRINDFDTNKRIWYENVLEFLVHILFSRRTKYCPNSNIKLNKNMCYIEDIYTSITFVR